MTLGPLANPAVAVRLRSAEWRDIVDVLRYADNDYTNGLADRIDTQVSDHEDRLYRADWEDAS